MKLDQQRLCSELHLDSVTCSSHGTHAKCMDNLSWGHVDLCIGFRGTYVDSHEQKECVYPSQDARVSLMH